MDILRTSMPHLPPPGLTQMYDKDNDTLRQHFELLKATENHKNALIEVHIY